MSAQAGATAKQRRPYAVRALVVPATGSSRCRDPEMSFYFGSIERRGAVMVKILYTTDATATGGREGRVQSSDGHVDIQLSLPTELGGPGGPGTNPEQLFAAGFAACFDNAMLLVARRMRLSAAGSRVTAKVGLGLLEAGRFGMEVELVVTLPELEPAEAQALVDATHKVCPFSNAVVGNCDVTLTVVPPSDVM
jgi:Ohr subfamily peroxiredoxin